ncbi:hypothetical protein AB5N19_03293 [Seiridium cardinale]
MGSEKIKRDLSLALVVVSFSILHTICTSASRIMDNSTTASRSQPAMAVRGLVTPPITPPKQTTQRKNRSRVRAAAEPYRRRSSQTNQPDGLSPLQRRPQRLPTSSASAANSDYPSPEPDRNTTIEPEHIDSMEGQSPENPICLDSEDEPPNLRGRPTRPQLPDQSQSAPTIISTCGLGAKGEASTRPAPCHAKSEPVARRRPTPAKVDKRIQACLRRKLPETQGTSEKVGNNYIFEAITAECSGQKLVKIGVTKNYEQSRLDNIARNCQHVLVDEQDDPVHMPIRLYKRAEQLMHKELEEYRHSWRCRCKMSHKEYFNVDKEVGLEVVQRWREFCRREPYDSDGKLRPFWADRLNKFNIICGNPGAHLDHESRARRWAKFMNPDKNEILRHDLKEVVGRLWKWRWQTIGLAQSFLIVLLTRLHVVSFFWFVLLVAGVLVENSDASLPIFPDALNWVASTVPRPSLSVVSTAEVGNASSGFVAVKQVQEEEEASGPNKEVAVD